MFLGGSLLAVSINFFPGFMPLYLLLRRGEITLESTEDDDYEYEYELVYEEDGDDGGGDVAEEGQQQQVEQYEEE